MSYIAKRLGFNKTLSEVAPEGAHFPVKNPIPIDLFPCTPQLVEMASEIYATDLVLFGYNMTSATESCSPRS